MGNPPHSIRCDYCPISNGRADNANPHEGQPGLICPLRENAAPSPFKSLHQDSPACVRRTQDCPCRAHLQPRSLPQPRPFLLLRCHNSNQAWRFPYCLCSLPPLCLFHRWLKLGRCPTQCLTPTLLMASGLPLFLLRDPGLLLQGLDAHPGPQAFAAWRGAASQALRQGKSWEMARVRPGAWSGDQQQLYEGSGCWWPPPSLPLEH